MTKNIIRLLIVLLFANSFVIAQDKNGELLFKAMQDEMARNMKELTLPAMQRPFFVEYTIIESKGYLVGATLGSINTIIETPIERESTVKVLVGDYHRTNLMNYETRKLNNGTALKITIDNNYDQIRRDLWRQTDRAYKMATEEYNRKMATLRQKNLTPEESAVDDLIKVAPVEKIIPPDNFVFDKARFSKMVEEVSSIFKDYPEIESSNVSVRLLSSEVYIVNSESSKYCFPNGMCSFSVSVKGRSDGKNINDLLSINALNDKDIPSTEEIKKKVKAFADKFIQMGNAQPVKDYYSGPVLFEDNAVTTLFERELFFSSGAFATRAPVQGQSPVTLQEKMNSKIMSYEYTVKCLPFLKEYDNTKLMGHFDIDLEGIIPEKELILIDKGTLVNVIGNRIPTKYNNTPSGYFRAGYSNTLYGQMMAGVVDISTSRGVSRDTLKQRLIRSARENGYNYGYIIRKIDGMGLPTYLYKVNVSDGKEELVKDAEIRDYRQGLLKVVSGTSNNRIVVNTGGTSFPVSFICPDAILLPDLEIAWKRDTQKITPPVVMNPLKDKI